MPNKQELQELYRPKSVSVGVTASTVHLGGKGRLQGTIKQRGEPRSKSAQRFHCMAELKQKAPF